MILYHETPKANLPSIRRKGLVAQCGETCVGLNAGQKRKCRGVLFLLAPRHEGFGKVAWSGGTLSGLVYRRTVNCGAPDQGGLGAYGLATRFAGNRERLGI